MKARGFLFPRPDRTPDRDARAPVKPDGQAFLHLGHLPLKLVGVRASGRLPDLDAILAAIRDEDGS